MVSRGLDPALHAGEWVFVTATEPVDSVDALATFRETEGVSMVLPRARADALGLSYEFVGAWISLGAQSALDEVGLTAAVSARLAAAGISCNVIAARYHDHLLVPLAHAEQALALLQEPVREPKLHAQSEDRAPEHP
jgi:uncharacterized protein